MFLKIESEQSSHLWKWELRVSIRRYCRIFLRSFDAHFFVAVLPFLAFLHRIFPPYFFAGIRACANMRFRPHHIGRQRRPFKGLWEFLLRRRVAQIFRATMAFCAKICVSLRVARLRFAVVKLFASKFQKNSGYMWEFVVLYVLTKGDFYGN